MTFTTEFLAQQKAQLEKDKGRLDEELSRIAKKDPVVPHDYDTTFPEYGRDPESNALEEEHYEARLGVEQSLEVHLRDVTAALGRLEQGTYGRCTVCGEAIAEERLKAFPAAATCMQHA